MEYKNIVLEIENGIGTLSLNRPESFNSINKPMALEMMDAFERIKNSEEIRVLVLRGEGKAFCAGGDVKEMQESKDRDHPDTLDYVNLFNSMAKMLINLPKPVITSVNGVAVGAGANIALAGDIIIASKKAKFSQIFSNIGLVPDAGGTYLLPRLVGRAKAKELVFLNTMVTAEEAKDMGMINRVVEAEDLEKEVGQLAQRLAKGPTKAYAAAKKMLNQSFETNVSDALDLETFMQSACFMTQDYAEGRDALLEKRNPEFTGK